MHRTVSRRLPRAFGVTLLLAVLAASALAGPAAADPLLDQKQAQYEKARREVRRLDNRVELITERYNATVIAAAPASRPDQGCQPQAGRRRGAPRVRGGRARRADGRPLQGPRREHAGHRAGRLVAGRGHRVSRHQAALRRRRYVCRRRDPGHTRRDRSRARGADPGESAGAPTRSASSSDGATRSQRCWPSGGA